MEYLSLSQWNLCLSLQGLYFSLELALKEANSGDPGVSLGKELFKEMNQLLEKSSINLEILDNLSDPYPLRLTLNQLMGVENSTIEQYVRFNLRGLCFSLAVALKEANPEDPGKKLLNELNQLLQENNSNLETLENLSDSYLPRLILQGFCNAFFSDTKVKSYLGDDFKFRSTTDSALWDEINKLLLRTSDLTAQNWQQKACQLAKEVGVQVDENESKAIQIPFSGDKLLYPGLSGTINVQGLFLSTKAPLDSRITNDNDNLEGDLKLLAQIVSICLHFIETDSSLHHCLKSIYRFGIDSFNPKQKSQYIQTLVGLFQRVKNAENNDPVSALEARLDLDEAINSLVYLPIAATNSWWYKLQEEARKTLDRAVDRVRQEKSIAVNRKWLLGVREDIIKYTDSKNDVSYPLNTGGVPGHVMTCLRVYALIDEKHLPGRVIYFRK